MATRLERPRFFEGQYIGSADLEAVIAYARDLGREHALGPHSWGIAVGLDLVESAAEGGGVDYYVLPGFGWDGYGRPIVLLEPKQISASKFAGLPSGDQIVWLRYSEVPFQGLRPGFETCSAQDGYARVREGVEIEVGGFGLSQRQGGIEVAGIATADARLAPRLFQDAAPDSKDNDAPILSDGAVPHQQFPPDSKRWLVPLGVATWQDGTPGLLKARSEDSLKLSRTKRQMAGAVAESLFAADGVIRLRDRFAQFREGIPLDDLVAPLKSADLEKAADVTDSSKTVPRLVGKELVWVEGNLRVTGQARLFGTRLELRDSAGEEAQGVPLYARRGTNPANAAGQDFQIVIGQDSGDKNRLVVGPAPAPYGTIAERFVLRSDGAFAFGNAIPADLHGDSGLVAATDGVTIGLAAAAGKTGKLAFQALPSLTDLAHIAYDDGAAKALRLGAGTDLACFSYWTRNGDVGIGTEAPQARIDIREVGGTHSLRIGAAAIAAFDDQDPARLDLQSAGGSLHIHADLAQSARVAITKTGRVGLGTSSPTTALHIIQASPVLRIASSGGGDAGIELASGGETSFVHEVGTGRFVLRNSGTASLVCAGDRVGINLGGGQPVTNLHVRGNLTGDADFDSSHVALIENVGGSSSDVLALRVGSVADASNNFITFYDSTGPIGRIERASLGFNDPSARNPADSGSFLRLMSGGADFAEFLPRSGRAAPIGASRIVGIRRGEVSLDTEGADALMITTDRAVVVGNARGDEAAGEMVAFVGQVFVEVDGPVGSGDFILPSGRNDGSGRAVAPGRLAPADASRVVGRAWSDWPEAAPGRVCVAVGVQGADALSALSTALANQQRTIDALGRALRSTDPPGESD